MVNSISEEIHLVLLRMPSPLTSTTSGPPESPWHASLQDPVPVQPGMPAQIIDFFICLPYEVGEPHSSRAMIVTFA